MAGDRDQDRPARERGPSVVDEPDLEPTEVEPAGAQPEIVDPSRDAELEQPGGLLGLLLWPLRAAISLALQVFAAFVQGLLGAIFPALRDKQGDDDQG